MEILLTKLPNGAFHPADAQEVEKTRRFKVGAVVRANVSQMRNYEHHKKFFAMLGLGFDAWEPPQLEHNGLPVQKNFDRFRKDCVIAAGFYEPVCNLRGEVRAEAKSISFANMSQDEFDEVYSKVADVILQRVLTKYTRDDLDRVVQEMMSFL
jgi:hypothetical protein